MAYQLLLTVRLLDLKQWFESCQALKGKAWTT